jgi:outer membrane lipoprotein LolB
MNRMFECRGGHGWTRAAEQKSRFSSALFTNFGYAPGMIIPRFRSRYLPFLLLLLTLVSACTHLPKSALPVNDIWDSRRVELAGIQHWRLRARIGIVTESESGSADLSWEQDGAAFTLKVTGALGRGLIAIEGDGESVSMRTEKGEALRAASAEDLILQRTGWRIPVSGLRHWVLGLPSGLYADETYVLDNAGRLEKLEGGGWQVEYRSYKTYGGYQLPDKIRLQNEQVKIRLAVIDWEIINTVNNDQ